MLDRVALVIRPRAPWEAVDLGLQMTRAWWRPVLRLWLMLTAPLFLLFNVIFVAEPFWAILAFWWLKPLFDRYLLHFYSKAAFGDVPRVRDCLGATRSLLTTQLLQSLTWYRWELARSFTLPVRQLERLKGTRRRKRLVLLRGRNAGETAVWMTLGLIGLEGVLSFFPVALSYILFEHGMFQSAFEFEQVMIFIDEFYASEGWRAYLPNLFYYLAVTVIEPLYVAGGFGLYLSRRTELEAWDVELSFRRLARRMDASGEVA